MLKTDCLAHIMPVLLCPYDVWKLSHPEAIRIYRQEERRSRADAKAVKRARRRVAQKG
jgi:hypothetical protein